MVASATNSSITDHDDDNNDDNNGDNNGDNDDNDNDNNHGGNYYNGGDLATVAAGADAGRGGFTALLQQAHSLHSPNKPTTDTTDTTPVLHTPSANTTITVAAALPTDGNAGDA